jgi:hypothetical protein
MNILTDVITKYSLKVQEFSIIDKTEKIKNATFMLYNGINGKITIKKINELFVLMVMIIGLEKTVKLLMFIIGTLYRSFILFKRMTTSKNIHNIQNIDSIENRVCQIAKTTDNINQSLDMIIFKQNKTEELLICMNKNLLKDIDNIDNNFNNINDRLGNQGTDKYSYLQSTDLASLTGNTYDTINNQIPIAYNE